MNQEIIAEIRNKLQTPKTTLELLAKGDSVPEDFRELALRELNEAIKLLESAP